MRGPQLFGRRAALSAAQNLAGGAPARELYSEDVHLAVLRSCGTNVPGLWVSDGALLRSGEEQQRLRFQSTVRRAALCTSSRCPPLREPLHCSSTHPRTPARTLGLSGGTLREIAAKISNCCLCFARR